MRCISEWDEMVVLFVVVGTQYAERQRIITVAWPFSVGTHTQTIAPRVGINNQISLAMTERAAVSPSVFSTVVVVLGCGVMNAPTDRR